MTTQPTSEALPAGTRLGRVALRVAALDEVTAFYRDVVGLDVLAERDAATTLGAGDQQLLVLEAAPDAPPRPAAATGLYHTAFRFPDRAALGDALGRVRERWRLDGASDHLVSEALYLTDPEGNGVELYRDRPRDDWPRTASGGVDMATDPLDLDALAAAAGGDADATAGDADATAGDGGAPPGTDVGHVHLEVSSLDEFRAFYVGAVGFEQQTTYPGASFVSADGYHHHVGANTWNDRSSPATGCGLAWFEVVLPDADALDALERRLADGGIAVSDLEGGHDATVPRDVSETGFAVADPDAIEIHART